ncbi:hypothetical protein [Metapseudomonas otitidis]|nr:hypothetical protein [Pseudomonas otitidis]
MMIELANTWLFEKIENPVAAAAGAYMLLSHPKEANTRFAASWQRWIRNLYKWFPMLPDGAIAMAQMELICGEGKRGEEVNVERLRQYVLEAVRRGLPFLSTGVRRLTEMLVMLEGDDREKKREGPEIEETRRALSLIRQLGRITVPSEFFTVLRQDGLNI